MDPRVRDLTALLTKVEGVAAWDLDAELRLLASTSTDTLWHRVFTATGMDHEAARAGGTQEALLRLDDELGLSWLLAATPEGGCIVLGPTLASEASEARVHRVLARTSLSPEERQAVKDRLGELPSLTTHSLSQYGRMLHSCLHPDHVGYIVVESVTVGDDADYAEYVLNTPQEAWASENLRLRIIENGTINYQGLLQRDPLMGGARGLPAAVPLKQSKISFQVFAGLCARAAIRGGCRADAMWALNDRYNMAFEDARSIEDLYGVSQRMFDDFVRQVRTVKSRETRSRIVRVCLELLEAHLYEPYPLSALARDAGYTPYYLTREFRKEMGVTVAAHVQAMKVEEAKALLRTSHRPIKDIADNLAFSSPSHFIACFRREAGMTPKEYRDSWRTPAPAQVEGR